MRANVVEEPKISLGNVHNKLEFSKSTKWRTLQKNLTLKAYKVQITENHWIIQLDLKTTS